jgi:hypothetical protein
MDEGNGLKGISLFLLFLHMLHYDFRRSDGFHGPPTRVFITLLFQLQYSFNIVLKSLMQRWVKISNGK